MMNYIQILDHARTCGLATEKKLWETLAALSADLMQLADTDPKLYRTILRRQHALLYARHYSESMANHDVRELVWSGPTDEEGNPYGEGAHWTRIKVEELTKGMKFHAKVNTWDKYVAFNTMYADLCATVKDEKTIIATAYAFFFGDADWQYEDDCTKIWDYMTLRKSI